MSHGFALRPFAFLELLRNVPRLLQTEHTRDSGKLRPSAPASGCIGRLRGQTGQDKGRPALPWPAVTLARPAGASSGARQWRPGESRRGKGKGEWESGEGRVPVLYMCTARWQSHAARAVCMVCMVWSDIAVHQFQIPILPQKRDWTSIFVLSYLLIRLV